jgi:hypothetical protein
MIFTFFLSRQLSISCTLTPTQRPLKGMDKAYIVYEKDILSVLPGLLLTYYIIIVDFVIRCYNMVESYSLLKSGLGIPSMVVK